MALKRSETFDAIAEQYDRARPGYPAELIATIGEVAGLNPGSRLLEIGSGTGKATRPFAEQGYSILCVEPGRNLAAVAARNLRAFPNVTIEVSTFEAVRLPPEPFDLAVAAQAFHWIDAEIGFKKSAEALRQDGWLALFWNTSALEEPEEGELFAAIEAAYQACAPSLTYANANVPQSEQQAQKNQERADAIVRSGYFQNVKLWEFPWTQRYTTRQYLDLLDTHSDHRLLPEADRQNLYAEVERILNAHGGSFRKPYSTVLYMAQKR